MENSSQLSTILVQSTDGAIGGIGKKGKDGENSKQAGTGQNGSDGSYNIIFGCTAATNGTAGASAAVTEDGKPTDGGIGGDGDAPYHFTMRVDTFIFPNETDMYILSQGGAGGRGGVGGDGGIGADGGDAGNTSADDYAKYDKKCIATGKCPPATGGYGGDGAPSGKGGKGGSGGTGGLVIINYKNSKDINRVIVSVAGGDAGKPGASGKGGKAGAGGKNEIWPAGSAQTFAPNGNDGNDSGDNGGGLPGISGTFQLNKYT